MRQLLHQLRWQLLILHRNNIIAISLVVTLAYAALFFVVRQWGDPAKLLVLFLYNDTAVIGLFFIGIAIILERNQGVLSAIAVAPASWHHYLLVRIVALSGIGWICGLAMALAALGPGFHWLHFSVGVWGVCLLSSLAGIYLVSRSSEVLQFLLRSVPVLLFFFNPPLLNYFELTAIDVFYILPVQGTLNLIVGSFDPEVGNGALAYGYLSMLLWLPSLYYIVYQSFTRKMVEV